MSLLISVDLVMIPSGGGFDRMGQPSRLFTSSLDRVAALQIFDPATELPIEDSGDIYIDNEMLIGIEELLTAKLRDSGVCIITTFSGDSGAIHQVLEGCRSSARRKRFSASYPTPSPN
jgi:hypothetical protein